MISEDLHALGFDFPTWPDLIDALLDAGVYGIEQVGPYRDVALYHDEDGAGVCLVRYEDDPLFTVCSLTGACGTSVRGYQIGPSLALLDVYDSAGDMHTRLLVTVNDPHCYPMYPFEEYGELAVYEDYRLSGAALDVKLYPSVEEWKAEQEPVHASRLAAQGGPSDIYLGPQFVTSPWLFALFAGDCAPDEANSAAMFKATISEVELKTNPLTGQPWYKVYANCGFPIVVALPGDVEGEPIPGGVIDGSVMLLGSTGFWDRDECG